MSLICFPIKEEHIPTVLNNIRIAACHPKAKLVLLAAAVDNQCYRQICHAIDDVNQSDNPYPVPVRTIIQSRIGGLRSGKGDGMNSAMQYFLTAHLDEENRLSKPLERIHFYDADIKSFDESWITKAEDGAARNYDVVRHHFPRSSTDAQVTWQVTKVGFALLWPQSTLPWIQQPLGGELCFSRHVVETLISDKRVLNQSDWGIDTLYTFVCAQNGFSLLEVYVPQGKVHALYGGLRDLKKMLCECFSAIQSLKNEDMKQMQLKKHHIVPAGTVPTSITQKIGYDIESSLKLLCENWSERQKDLITKFDDNIHNGLLSASDWPEWRFMDENAWISAYQVLLEEFDLEDEDWREILFKLWVTRVLNYTMRHVTRGYDCALEENANMVINLHMRRSIEVTKELNMKEFDLDISTADPNSIDSIDPYDDTRVGRM